MEYKTPRLLFRVWSRNSNGLNAVSRFAPAAKVRMDGSLAQDSAVEPLAITREQLELALNWKEYPDVPIMFCTSTLLFALVYAGYLQANGNKDINITCIVTHTTKTSAGGPVIFHTVKSMMDKSNVVLKNKDQSVRKYEDVLVAMTDLYPGEGSCYASYEKLIANGLYELYPELKEVRRAYRARFNLTICHFRDYWFEHSWNLDEARINTAARLAACFQPINGMQPNVLSFRHGPETTDLLIAWFLALRKADDSHFDLVLKNERSSRATVQSLVDVGDTAIPEIAQYSKLCEKIVGSGISGNRVGFGTQIDQQSIEKEIKEWNVWRRKIIDERRAARPDTGDQEPRRRRHERPRKQSYRRTKAKRVEKPKKW